LEGLRLGQMRMRVDESWQARVCTRVFSTLMPWSNENKSCMRVEKREFVRELRSESLYESFLNSHALVKREQELHESFLNSRVPVKQEQELHES
jgi:hypothetical protein